MHPKTCSLREDQKCDEIRAETPFHLTLNSFVPFDSVLEARIRSGSGGMMSMLLPCRAGLGRNPNLKYLFQGRYSPLNNSVSVQGLCNVFCDKEGTVAIVHFEHLVSAVIFIAFLQARTDVRSLYFTCQSPIQNQEL